MKRIILTPNKKWILDSSCLAYVQMYGFYEHCTEHSGSIKSLIILTKGVKQIPASCIYFAIYGTTGSNQHNHPFRSSSNT
jgi:hypothetical protein